MKKKKDILSIFNRASTALVLVVMMVVTSFSAIAVSYDIDASGDNFSNSSDIYIDTSGFTDWEDDGAKFGALFYYGDNSNWCYEYNSGDYNPPVDKTLDSSKVETATKVDDHIYKLTVPASNLGSLIVLRLSSGNQIWNATGKMFCSSSKNCVKISDWDNSASWSTYSSGSTGGSYKYEYTANISSSMNDSSIKYKADMSLYDYLDDNEYSNGWGNVKVAGNSATWYPFSEFNSKLSSYYNTNGIRTPLYFGNFNTGTQDEEDRRNEYDNNKNGLYKFKTAANNSKAVYYHGKYGSDIDGTSTLEFSKYANLTNDLDYSYSYQGIVSKDLGADNNLNMVTGSGGSYSTAAAPFFNDDFLKSNRIGKKVNAVLPFTYDSNSEKYSYKASTTTTHSSPINNIYLSSGSTNNNNMSGVDTNGLTLHYGGSDTSKGIKDGKKWFNSGDSGYGFFPFNNNTISHTNDDVRNYLDYGFGMNLSIPFSLPDNKKTSKGNDIEFTFTGDDDIWIYIDGKLVVDLGGDHKDSTCTINFTEGTTTYGRDSSGATAIDTRDMPGSAGTAYALNDAMDSSKDIHNLTMFYMERGLIESNMEVQFSFTPLKNNLKVDKTVDAGDVAESMQTVVKDMDQFGFEVKSGSSAFSCTTEASGKDYTYTDSINGTTKTLTATTDSDGKFPLADGDSAFFNGTFDASTSATDKKFINIVEGEPVENECTASNNVVYLDPSPCSWFFNDDAKPYIRFSGHTTWHKMKTITSGGKTYYYYPVQDGVTKFYICRMVGEEQIQTREFSYPIDSSKHNLITSGNHWKNDTPTYSTYSGTKPDKGVVGTTNTRKLSYDTMWVLKDTDNGTVINSKDYTASNTDTANFEFINSSNDYNKKTSLALSYTNKVKVGSLVVNKKVFEDANDGTSTTPVKGDEVPSDNTEFKVKISFDTDGDGVYESYDIPYNITSTEPLPAPINGTAAEVNGLSQTQTITFTKIPLNIPYQLEEISANGYVAVQDTFKGTVTDSETPATHTFENIIQPATSHLEVIKSFDDEAYVSGSNELFTFTVTEIDENGNNVDNGINEDIFSNINGTVTFSDITYSSAGNYYYEITEQRTNNLPGNDVHMDKNAVFAKVTVTSGTQGLIANAPVYYKGMNFNKNNFSNGSTDTLTIENYQNLGKVTITKTDKLGSDGKPTEDATLIANTKFKIYCKNSDGKYVTMKNDDGSDIELATSDTDATRGQVTFENLPIYAKNSDGKWLDGNNGREQVYQDYMVKESEPAPGYTPTEAAYGFNFENCANFEVAPTEIVVGDKTYDGCYCATGAVVDAPINVPLTGLSRSFTDFVVIGLGVVGFAGLLGAYYVYSTKRRKARAYVSRHGR